MAAEGEKVGGIYIEADVDLSKLEHGLGELTRMTDAYKSKNIDVKLNLEKNLPKTQRSVPLVASWEQGTLSRLQAALDRRAYKLEVRHATLSAGAVNELRAAVAKALKDYVIEVGVNAKIVGQKGALTISAASVGPADSSAPANAGTVRTRATTAAAVRAPSPGRSGSTSTARPAAQPAASASSSNQAEIADLKAKRAAIVQQVQELQAQLEATAKLRAANARGRQLHPAEIEAARRMTYITRDQPKLNPEWSRTIMGLDTGKPLTGGTLQTKATMTAIRAGIARTIQTTMEAHRRVVALQEEAETGDAIPWSRRKPSGPPPTPSVRRSGTAPVWRAVAEARTEGGENEQLGRDAEGEALLHRQGGDLRRRGNRRGFRKYGHADGPSPFAGSYDEALAAQMSSLDSPAWNPGPMAEGVNWKDISKDYLAQSGNKGTSKAYLSTFVEDLKKRVGNKKFGRGLKAYGPGGKGLMAGIPDQEAADFTALSGLLGEHEKQWGPEQWGDTYGKRRSGSVMPMGYGTEAAIAVQRAREAAEERSARRALARSSSPLRIVGVPSNSELTKLGKNRNRAMKRSGTTAAHKMAASYGFARDAFDTPDDALDGFEGKRFEPLPSAPNQPGMDTARMGWAQTPESQNAAFNRGMHKTRKGQWWWNKQETIGPGQVGPPVTTRARRASGEEVAEYQRIQAQHRAAAATRAGLITSESTRPSALSGRATAEPYRAPATGEASDTTSDYGQKFRELYIEPGSRALRRSLRQARNAESKARAAYKPTIVAARGSKARFRMEDIEAYRSQAQESGDLSEEQVGLLGRYGQQGFPLSRSAVKERRGEFYAQHPEERIARIPLARAQEQRAMAAENVQAIADQGATGGGGGGSVSISGPIDVNVLNFSDLAGMLKNTSVAEGFRKPEELAKEFGISKEDAEDLAKTFPGGGGGGEPAAKHLKKSPLGRAARYEMTDASRGVAQVFDPAEYEREEQLAEAKKAQSRDRTVTANTKRYAREDEMAVRSAERADAADKRRTERGEKTAKAQADRKATADAKKAASGPGGPTQAATEFSLSEYTKSRNLPTPAIRQRTARVNRDPVEVAMERAQAASTRAEFPERAPSIAVGQLFSRAIGFKTRYQQAQEELTLRRGNQENAQKELVREMESRDVLQEKVAGVSAYLKERKKEGPLSDADKLARKEVIGLWQTQQRRVAAATLEVDKQTKGVNDQREAVEKSAGAFEKVASIGALFVGAKAFTIGLAAVSAGLGLVEKAGGKAVDQMMGFGATSTHVTNQLAEQTKALHGNTEAVYGAAALSAGLSEQASKFLKNGTIATAQAKAGGIAQGETSDLFRANLGLGDSPQGLYGGYGGLFNGAFLGSELGGGKGYAEQVIADLSIFKRQQDAPYAVQRPQGNTQPGTEPYFDFATIFGTNPVETGQTVTRPGALAQASKAAKSQEKYLNDQNAAYERNYKYLGKASDGLQLVAQQGPEAADAMSMVANQLTGEAKTAAENMAKANLAITDASGNVITTAAEFQDYWQNSASGKTRPEASSVYQQQTWQLQAQLQAQKAGYDYQTTNKIPGQWGLGLGINPLQQFAGPGTAYSQMLRNVPAKDRAGLAAGAATAQSERDKTQGEATAQSQLMVDKAVAQMRSPMGQVAGFTSTGANNDVASLQTNLNDVLRLGKDIAAISQEISFNNAAQQADEMKNSLRLAKRALEDARGLAGQGGGSALGGIQRQQYMLGRESTSLSLGMSQRQINFQTAVAGFQAPGLTSEERAARMEQAKLEAAYAQKQLDIQKKQFALAGKEFGISTGRAVVDALKSVGLIGKGLSRAAENATLAATMETLQHQQNLKVAQLNEGLAAADAIFNTGVSTAASAAATLGIALADATTALGDWVLGLPGVTAAPSTKPATGGTYSRDPKEGEVSSAANAKVIANAVAVTKAVDKSAASMARTQAKALAAMALATASYTLVISKYTGAVIKSITDVFAAITASSNAYQAQAGGGNGNSGKVVKNASGFLGTVSGATNMIMGEAGDETVAILRNPRNVSASGSGGGGGTSIVIQINNPSVRNDGDITAIAREVEKVMNRKASLIGLRSIS